MSDELKRTVRNGCASAWRQAIFRHHTAHPEKDYSRRGDRSRPRDGNLRAGGEAVEASLSNVAFPDWLETANRSGNASAAGEPFTDGSVPQWSPRHRGEGAFRAIQWRPRSARPIRRGPLFPERSSAKRTSRREQGPSASVAGD